MVRIEGQEGGHSAVQGCLRDVPLTDTDHLPGQKKMVPVDRARVERDRSRAPASECDWGEGSLRRNQSESASTSRGTKSKKTAML